MWPAVTSSGLWIAPRLRWGHDFSAMEMLIVKRGRQRPNGLQWSHDFSAMEMIFHLTAATAADTLQWSHDFPAMEIVDYVRQTIYEGNASMEPRLFSHGNNIP
ncbi:MAG: hypothetical protein JRE23_16375, partial [Deltaproteobacteria bacterium]|nr:hypothetical protein [Deltaproteobacteria bacterium]